MSHECLPQDAPLPEAPKQYEKWATRFYQELSGAPDSKSQSADHQHLMVHKLFYAVIE